MKSSAETGKLPDTLDQLLDDMIEVISAVANGTCCNTIVQDDCNANPVARTYFSKRELARKILDKLGRTNRIDREYSWSKK